MLGVRHTTENWRRRLILTAAPIMPLGYRFQTNHGAKFAVCVMTAFISFSHTFQVLDG
jgi:hypothetical protein